MMCHFCFTSSCANRPSKSKNKLVCRIKKENSNNQEHPKKKYQKQKSENRQKLTKQNNCLSVGLRWVGKTAKLTLKHKGLSQNGRQSLGVLCQHHNV